MDKPVRVRHKLKVTGTCGICGELVTWKAARPEPAQATLRCICNFATNKGKPYGNR